jgi:hypothetical protein
MNLFDRLLDLVGLQRKTNAAPASEQKPVEAEPENVYDAIHRRQKEVSEKLLKATHAYVSAQYEKRAELLEQVTQDMKNDTITDETRAKIRFLFEQPHEKLSPEIEQALRDALEKRGREDEEPPTDESNK